MSTDNWTEGQINALTERIIGCAFRVHNVLGYGYLEKVYDNALAHELRKNGLHVDQQVRLVVWYDGVIVGEFIADQVVERCVQVEVKAQLRGLEPADIAQSLNYLTCTRLPVGLLLNFARRVEIKRHAGEAFRDLPGNQGKSATDDTDTHR